MRTIQKQGATALPETQTRASAWPARCCDCKRHFAPAFLGQARCWPCVNAKARAWAARNQLSLPLTMPHTGGHGQP